MRKVTLILIFILGLPISSNGQGIADVLKLPSGGLLPGDADMQPIYNLDYLDLGIGSSILPGPGPSSTIFSKIISIDSHWMVLQTTNDTNDHIVLLPSGNVGINMPYNPSTSWYYNPWAKLHVFSSVKTTRTSPMFLLQEGIPTVSLASPEEPEWSLQAAPEPEPEPLALPLGYLMVYFGNGLSNFDSYSDYTFGFGGTERVRITNAGNVGIGTTNPSTRLEVVAPNIAGARSLTVTTTNPNDGMAIRNDGSDTDADVWLNITGRKGGVAKPTYLGYSPSLDAFRIAYATGVGGADGISIKSGGNVGIGTTTPRSILEVKSEAGNPVGTFTTFPTPGSALSWGTQGIGLNLVRKSTGTWEAAGDGANNAGAAIFGSMGPEGLRFVAVESTGSSNQTFTDTQIMGKVRMVIRSDGNVGIGTTAPTEKLDVNGTARLRGISAGSGTTVVADTNGKLYKQSSSIKYKTNIQDLEDNADNVLELRPVRFQWKTTGQEEIGLIAEEVEGIAKDLVVYDREGKPDAVKYDKIALYLLSVVKAQQQKIAELEAAQADNKSLTQRLNTLEQIVNK